MPDKLKVTVQDEAGSFRQALAIEWGLTDCEAACLVRQGHAPSLASAMLGVGVLKLLKPRAEKELPRKFVLAATRDRVLAFDASSHSRGERSDAVLHVTIEPGEIASWPRADVSMRADEGGMNQNATLVIAGKEVPCAVPDGNADDAFRELIAKLGGAPRRPELGGHRLAPLPSRPAPDLRRLRLDELGQEPARVGLGVPGDLLGRSRGEQVAAGLAALGAQVDDPVG